MRSNLDYTGGILPPDFIAFIQVSAVLGFIATLVLTTAVVYKYLGKVLGEERVKKYRSVFVIADVVVLLVFIFIYIVVF